jgi:hypothetical protein
MGIYGTKGQLRVNGKAMTAASDIEAVPSWHHGDGIYGKRWHLRAAAREMPFIVAMASMGKDGIYERQHGACRSSSRWHLWQKMASMSGSMWMLFIVAMASMENDGIYGESHWRGGLIILRPSCEPSSRRHATPL